MSALDTVTGSFVLGDTLPTDLPANMPDNWDGTTAQPEVAEIPRSEPGISISGILDSISATAKTGLDIFKTVAQIDQSAATFDAQRRIQSAQLDLAKVQNLNAVDVAKANNNAATEIARIQAQSALEKAKQTAAAATQPVYGGAGQFIARVASSPNFYLLGGAALAAYYLLRKKGKK